MLLNVPFYPINISHCSGRRTEMTDICSGTGDTQHIQFIDIQIRGSGPVTRSCLCPVSSHGLRRHFIVIRIHLYGQRSIEPPPREPIFDQSVSDAV